MNLETNKMIFLNITWMHEYKGIQGVDMDLSGGGSYVDENKFGLEVYNFKPINGYVYGYVQPPGPRSDSETKVRIERLGARKDSEKIDDILVVFTARDPKIGGVHIVGWYKNATFYRELQNDYMEERKYKEMYCGYFAKTKVEDATPLPVHLREAFPRIPRASQMKGGQGQSNVWYADTPQMESFKQEVIDKIIEYERNKEEIWK